MLLFQKRFRSCRDPKAWPVGRVTPLGRRWVCYYWFREAGLKGVAGKVRVYVAKLQPLVLMSRNPCSTVAKKNEFEN